MSKQKEPTTGTEVWQRGPVAGIPALLQPVAHAILQVHEELQALLHDFSDEQLWVSPAGLATPAFHLQHLSGVLDRLFTYARGSQLSAEQYEQLKAEKTGRQSGITVQKLLQRFEEQLDRCLKQLQQTPEDTLTAARGIGSKQLPTTVIGLLFHAAEHTTRHYGQLYVTVTIIRSGQLSELT